MIGRKWRNRSKPFFFNAYRIRADTHASSDRANELSYVELFAWQKARGSWKVFGRVIVATIQPRRDNLGRFRLEISRLDISGFPR